MLMSLSEFIISLYEASTMFLSVALSLDRRHSSRGAISKYTHSSLWISDVEYWNIKPHGQGVMILRIGFIGEIVLTGVIGMRSKGKKFLSAVEVFGSIVGLFWFAFEAEQKAQWQQQLLRRQ